MPSQKLASGENLLKGELAAAWNIFEGSSGDYTDLGIARRFGGAAAAYSLRDIGAMNGRVVKVRRDLAGEEADPEEDFSANQVSSGALENWVNGKLEDTLPADVDTAAAAYSLRKAKESYSGDAVRIRRSSDDAEINVALDSNNKVSTSSSISVVSGSTTATTLGEFITTDAAPNFSGNSLLFNGTDTNVGITQITLSGDFTFSFDAFLDFSESNGGRVAGRTSGNGWVVNFETDGSGITTRPDDVSGVSIDFDSTLSSGEHSFVLTRSSGTITLSVDGVTQADTGTKTEDYTINFIGRNASQYFKGSLRNININGVASYNGYGNTDADWIDQIGSNNGTVNGTADKFLGVSSFVHTWYDQVGSNNAVQATSPNQPKIAESGALLANGIFFDGSNDKFEATDITNVNFPATIVSVSSIDTTGSNRGLYSLNTGGTAATGFYRSTNKYAINNGTSLEGSKTYSTGVTNLKFDVFNGSSSTGFNDAVSDISGDAGTTQAQVTHFKIGDSDRIGITGSPLNGHIKEIILYTSDQSNNRFKIESNINNYYGLYNDENDMLTDWSDDPTAPYGSAFTSNGKDGYTVDYSAGVASTRARWQFEDNVASGDTIYYSFNASITSGTPSIITKQSDGTSNAQSSSVAISNGFNSGSITTNAEAVYFAIGDTEGTQSFTISDFRVSRIVRNGFVETWYDQSGNGEDMTQDTSGKQPSIVVNGGQVKDYNGNNSIDFVSGSTRVLEKSGTTTAKTCIIVLDEDSSGSSERAILGFSDSTSFMRLDTTVDVELKAGGVTGNYRAMPTDVTSLYFWYTNGTDEDNLFANNVEEGDTTANTPPNLPFTRIGARNSDSDPYNSRITEVITFADDLSADRIVLQNDINNNYNIF